MMRWRFWSPHRGHQSIDRAQVEGHVFQIQSEGDVTIDSAFMGSATDPGMVSITPPAEYAGRPIRGREALIEKIFSDAVSGDDKRKVRVLHGIGGGGKSTVAMLIAHKAYGQQIDTWWVNATDVALLYASMRQLASKLGAPQERITRAWSGKESAIDLVWEYLNQYPKRWLLIFDGADDPHMLAASGSLLRDGNGWLRPTGETLGSVLVTTRDSKLENWSNWCNLQLVESLSPDVGAEVLIEYAGTRPGSLSDAANLSRRLGGLPLALRLAGTYLQSTRRMSWPGSITRFEEYRRALDDARVADLFPELDVDDRVEGDREARELIGRTWELSLRLLERRGMSSARPVLQLLSHFSEVPIPNRVLNVRALSSFGFKDIASLNRLQETIEALIDFGLLDIRRFDAGKPEEVALLLHPLVRDVSRYTAALRYSRTVYHSAAAIMLAEMVSGMEEPQWDHWPLWQLLSRHSFYLLEELRDDRQADSTAMSAAAYCTHRSGRFLMERAEFQEAILRHRSALDAYEGVVGPDDPGNLYIRHDIAVALGHVGNLADAASELRNVYERRVAVHGSDSKQSLATLHAYADVLWQSGDLISAQSAYEHILDVLGRRGDYNSNALGTENNLIQVLLELGELEAAASRVELMLEKTASVGLHETTILQVRFTRARVRRAQAKFDAAIDELQIVYEGHSRMLGESHTVTLSTRHELGVALQESGRSEEACTVLEATFELRRKKSGGDHHETLSTRHQLALALHEANRRDEARAHYVATLHARETVHGPNNHLTLATRYQLAVLLEESGNPLKAEVEFRRVLAGERSSLGYNHPSTLITRTKLVEYEVARGKYGAAIAELNRILVAQRSIFDPGHPSIGRTEVLIDQIREVMRFSRVSAPRRRRRPK